MPSDLTPPAQEAIALAKRFASECGEDEVRPEHLLFGLSAVEGTFSGRLLGDADLTPERIRDAVFRSGREQDRHGLRDDLTLAPETAAIIERCVRLAETMGHSLAGTEHLLVALGQATTAKVAHELLIEHDLQGALRPSDIFESRS